jgi:hypothetical protein
MFTGGHVVVGRDLGITADEIIVIETGKNVNGFAMDKCTAIDKGAGIGEGIEFKTWAGGLKLHIHGGEVAKKKWEAVYKGELRGVVGMG